MIRQTPQQRIRVAIARCAVAFALCAAGFGPLLQAVHAFGPGGHYGWLAQHEASGAGVDRAPLSQHDDGHAAKCGTCAQLNGQRAALASAPVIVAVDSLPSLAPCEQDARAPQGAPLRLDPARGPPRIG